MRFLLRAIACFSTLAASAAIAGPHPLGDVRTVAAQQEMSTLAAAEETCAAFTGFYVALEALDDTGSPSIQRPYNFVNDGGGCRVMRPAAGLFNAARRVFTFQFGDPREWSGPFVAYQQGKTQTTPGPYDLGSPLDPWGSPYLFYSPLGLIRGDEGIVTLEYHGALFDRYTIASLGADGLVSGDDLYCQFGGGITGFALAALAGDGVSMPGDRQDLGKGDAPAMKLGGRPPVFHAPVGASLTIKGYNLGASAAGAAVMFGDLDVTSGITAWRITGTAPQQRVEIDLTLPNAARGEAQLRVTRGAASSNGLTLSLPGPDAAADWRRYR